MISKTDESEELKTKSEDKAKFSKSMLNTSLLVEVYKDKIAELETSSLDEKH